jgi:hypothetical protein
MVPWDFATCWQKLEEFYEETKDEQNAGEINLAHANRFVEALAHYGQESEDKARALLSQKVTSLVSCKKQLGERQARQQRRN